MANQDEILTSKVALSGFLGAIVLFVVILALQVVYYQATSRQQAARDAEDVPVQLRDALAQQQAKLTGYEVLDREKGTVRIPIDRAIELAVREAKGGPGHGPSK